MPFSKEVAEALLVKCARHCCLCRQFKGVKLEIHHIIPEAEGGPSTEQNGIPLCFDCHAEVGHSYNNKHPRGRKITHDELRQHRDGTFRIIAGNEEFAKRLEYQEETVRNLQELVSSLTTRDYPAALAVVASKYGATQEELCKALAENATRITALEKDSSLETTQALLAAGRFPEAEKSAVEFATYSRGQYQKLQGTLELSKTNQIDAMYFAALAALQDRRPSDALNLLNEVAPLLDREADAFRWAKLQRLHGFSLMALHRSEEALKVWLQILSAQKGSYPDESSRYEDMFNFGTVMMQCGALEQAEEMFTSCINLAQKLFEKTDKRLSIALHGLSMVNIEKGQLQYSEEVARKHLGLLKESNRLDSLEAAHGFYNLAAR